MSERSTSVLEQYDFQVARSIRGRGAMLCETDKGLVLLKEYNGSLLRLSVEDEILHGLKCAGTSVDAYVKNRSGQILSIDTDGTKYVLKNWFEAKECDVRNTAEILLAVGALARLHCALGGVSAELSPESREGLKRFTAPSLKDTFEKHQRVLKKVRTYMRAKQKKNEFELQTLRSFEEFFEQGELSIRMLKLSGYDSLKEQADRERQLCHGNYNQHNILIEGKKAAVVNFDRLSVDLQLTDLYLFMRKIQEKHNWDCRLCKMMLAEYEKGRALLPEEKRILKLLFLYPEKFWKLVNHYYNNNKAWIPQKDLEKLSAVVKQNQAKKECLEKIF